MINLNNRPSQIKLVAIYKLKEHLSEMNYTYFILSRITLRNLANKLWLFVQICILTNRSKEMETT